MTRTWNGRARPFARLAASTLTISALLLAGVGPALALDSGSGTGDHSEGTASTQGGYDEPQPESTADENSGGANGDCPDGSYCSTRDGSPSMNGEGDGEATGKPCAGCVGKADNKNPKGQSPDGSDGNAGYECDRNQGIGQSNPAHTGCADDTSSPPTARKRSLRSTTDCDDDTLAAQDESCSPCPADATTSADGENCGDAPARVAGTSRTTRHRAPTVLGVEAFGTPAAGGPGKPSAGGPLAAVLPAGLLPNTGAGAVLMLLLAGGAALLVLGTVILVARRRTARI